MRGNETNGPTGGRPLRAAGKPARFQQTGESGAACGHGSRQQQQGDRRGSNGSSSDGERSSGRRPADAPASGQEDEEARCPLAVLTQVAAQEQIERGKTSVDKSVAASGEQQQRPSADDQLAFRLGITPEELEQDRDLLIGNGLSSDDLELPPTPTRGTPTVSELLDDDVDGEEEDEDEGISSATRDDLFGPLPFLVEYDFDRERPCSLEVCERVRPRGVSLRTSESGW